MLGLIRWTLYAACIRWSRETSYLLAAVYWIGILDETKSIEKINMTPCGAGFKHILNFMLFASTPDQFLTYCKGCRLIVEHLTIFEIQIQGSQSLRIRAYT